MPPRDWRLRVDDILAAITNIEKYIGGLSFDEFRADQKTVDAVIRNLEVIGEATRHLSTDHEGLPADVPWADIAGMRSILVHEVPRSRPQHCLADRHSGSSFAASTPPTSAGELTPEGAFVAALGIPRSARPGGASRRSSSKKLKMKTTWSCLAAAGLSGAGATATRSPSGCRSKPTRPGRAGPPTPAASPRGTSRPLSCTRRP